jgi:hypothetical protein
MSGNSPELGKLITTDAARDAIHVAVAPAIAAETLYPGQRVGQTDAGTVGDVPIERTIGIVDPFLTHGVPAGQRFWLLLFPGTITGMRHEWEHPLFTGKADEPVAKKAKAPKLTAEEKAKAVIQKAADGCGISFERMMDAALLHAESGGSEYEYDNTEGYKDVEFGAPFWKAFTELTGVASPEWKGAPFTCSC